MGKVKNNLENLQQQIDFIGHAIHIMEGSDRQVVYSAENCDMLSDILANLKLVQNWIMLPDFHQAALQALDEAHIVNQKNNSDGLSYNSSFDVLVSILAELRKISNQDSVTDSNFKLQWVAAMSILGIAKFITPKGNQQ